MSDQPEGWGQWTDPLVESKAELPSMHCPNCDGDMVDRKDCKRACPRCGFFEDCSSL
jgi:hypothetical protein